MKNFAEFNDPKQRTAIFEKNKKANNGHLRSDVDGEFLVASKRSMGGVKKPPTNEAQIGHKQDRVSGGNNSSQNARVESREGNRNAAPGRGPGKKNKGA